MLSDRTKDALDGIRLNVEAIADFTRDVTFEQFATDRLRFYAVTRALEIISEASRRLPDDLKARYPAIRWRAIHDAGNVYRHTYSKVSVVSRVGHRLPTTRRLEGNRYPGTRCA